MSFRFGLRILLLIVLVVVCLGGWCTFRLQQVRQERASPHGKWRHIRENGTPVVFPDGKNIVVEFTEDNFRVDPFHEPKWLDFRIPGMSKPSKCIYHREGDRLRIAQASPGAPRP